MIQSKKSCNIKNILDRYSQSKKLLVLVDRKARKKRREMRNVNCRKNKLKTGVTY